MPTYHFAASHFCTASRTSLDDGCFRQLCCTCDSNGSEQFRQQFRHCRAIGKTRVAPKTSRFTTAWWLVWNWNNTIPLAMEYQVNHEKTQIFPKKKQTWFLSGKLVATYNFAASLFCTAQSLFRTILNHGSRRLSHSCDSCAAVFAVKIWAQMG